MYPKCRATNPPPQVPPPDGWRTVRLGDVCQFVYGDSLPTQMRTAGNAPVYGSNGMVGTHTVPLTSGPTPIIGRKGSVGEVHFSEVPCWPIDTTYYIEISAPGVDMRWLYYCLRSINFRELNKASAVPGLNREDAYRVPVGLPLAVQELLAARLTAQMQCVAQARAAARALAAAKSLPAAYRREAFAAGRRAIGGRRSARPTGICWLRRPPMARLCANDCWRPAR